MRWPKLSGRQCKGNKGTPPRHIVPVNADLSNFTMGRKCLMALLIRETALHCPGHNQCHKEVLPAMLKCAQVLDKVAANKLSKHEQEDHAIDLAGTNTHPFGPWYKLMTNEFKALWDYVSDNLARGSIRQPTLPAGAHTLFAREKDSILCLCVDYGGLNYITTKNQCPPPLLFKTLDRLLGAMMYTKINLQGTFALIGTKESN